MAKYVNEWKKSKEGFEVIPGNRTRSHCENFVKRLTFPFWNNRFGWPFGNLPGDWLVLILDKWESQVIFPVSSSHVFCYPPIIFVRLFRTELWQKNYDHWTYFVSFHNTEVLKSIVYAFSNVYVFFIRCFIQDKPSLFSLLPAEVIMPT